MKLHQGLKRGRTKDGSHIRLGKYMFLVDASEVMNVHLPSNPLLTILHVTLVALSSLFPELQNTKLRLLCRNVDFEGAFMRLQQIWDSRSLRPASLGSDQQ